MQNETLRLNTLKPGIGAKKVAKRVGRGSGSGMGKTSCRGHKGQKARTGGRAKWAFEGGQMPLQRRLPKFGFYSHAKKFKMTLKLRDLERLGLEEFSVASLIEHGVVPNYIKEIKIVATGELTRAVKCKGLLLSAAAREAILKQGGSIEAHE